MAVTAVSACALCYDSKRAWLPSTPKFIIDRPPKMGSALRDPNLSCCLRRPGRAIPELFMAAKVHHHQHPAEASIQATSAATRESDTPRPRPRERSSPQAQSREQAPHQLRQPAAGTFPPRRQARPPPQHCGGERNIRQQQQHRSCGEVVGGTAAGCAAVCCCFPCVTVEVVMLATVRAPAALCRKAALARRGGRRRSAPDPVGPEADMYDLLVDDGGGVVKTAGDMALPAEPMPEDSAELEKEVWARFYGAGFWRSPSQLGDENR